MDSQSQTHTYRSLTWQAPEYEHSKKGADWFWAVGIISASLILSAILFKDYLLAIILGLAIFSLSMYAIRLPKTITILINSNGIIINDILYSYSSLDSFWIELRHGTPKVLLKSKKIAMPIITVLLDHESVDPELARDILNDYLPEEEINEPFMLHLMHFLGF